MKKKIDAFLSMHNFPLQLSIDAALNAVLCDMEAGLTGKGLKAGEEMIRTFALPPKKKPANESVIVIDAGGTNFRSCLVTFSAEGVPAISELEKAAMPGVEKELSKKEFFDRIAENLEHLKNKATKIGFCFSYPMTITNDGDGILNGFSKRLKSWGAKLALACLTRSWSMAGIARRKSHSSTTPWRRFWRAQVRAVRDLIIHRTSDLFWALE